MLIHSPSQAWAIATARPIGNEHRIKIVNYIPNTVVRFVGHYTYNSIIEFAPDEEIKTITMGTSTGWQIHPEGNRIFLKPIETDATTNMTVITNRRMYFFEMHAEEAESIDDDNLAFIVKFVYPQNAPSHQAAVVVHNSVLPDLTHPELYNFRYQISGKSKNIEPILIFDDGEFTYFKFRNINAEIPAIFLVNGEGDESLINYRVTEGFIVIERVAERFTLRHGHDTICVFNQAYSQDSWEDTQV